MNTLYTWCESLLPVLSVLLWIQEEFLIILLQRENYVQEMVKYISLLRRLVSIWKLYKVISFFRRNQKTDNTDKLKHVEDIDLTTCPCFSHPHILLLVWLFHVQINDCKLSTPRWWQMCHLWLMCHMRSSGYHLLNKDIEWVN